MTYSTYYETGSLATGNHAIHIDRFRTLAQAKAHALQTADRTRLCVTVCRNGLEVWATRAGGGVS